MDTPLSSPHPLVIRSIRVSAVHLPAFCDAPEGLVDEGPTVLVRFGTTPLVQVCMGLDQSDSADRVVLVANGRRMARPIGERTAYDPFLFRMLHSIHCGFVGNLPPPETYLESLYGPLTEHLDQHYAMHSRERERHGLSDARLARALSVIESRLFENVPIDELAEAVHLSTFHFCHMFKRSTGAPPRAYIARRRIDAAALLLVATSLTMGEIAGRTGFRTQAHFCTVFRRVMGITPSRHRVVARAKATATAD